MNESDYTVCAIDTETSGLDPRLHEVLSLCIMPVNDKFEDLGLTLNLRIRANNPVDAKAIAINKLDPTVGIAKSEAWKTIREWRRKNLITKIVPLGHNISFDLMFLKTLMPNPTDFQDIFHYRFKDSMIMAQIINDVHFARKSVKFFNAVGLEKVSERLGIQNMVAHSAESDARTSLLCYKKMLGMLAIVEPT
ncbi:MAG TPA: 3'-5' exonuclease [Candidatus Cloacimonadota bacterium]|nr:3'-5' exonuclease [Candidatus Cloacimonadota bacterium]